MGEEEQQQQQNSAVEGVSSLLMKSHHDLSLVLLQLDHEFHSIYPNNANPMKLVSRIKNIQDELSSLQLQCRHLLSSKQELIDKATTILVGNRRLLQRMQPSVGIPLTPDSHDAAFSSFNQIIEEWTTHVRSKKGEDGDGSPPEDINNLLFASIVGST